MRKTLVFIIVLSSNLVFGQDFESSKNTLLNLNTIAGSELLNKLDPYEPKSSREEERLKIAKEFYDKLISNYALEVLYEELKSRKGIILEDKSALKSYITYDDGLPVLFIPKSAIKNITKKGYVTDYFFNVALSVSLNTVMQALPGKAKPEVTCTIKIFTPERDLTKKVSQKIKDKKGVRNKDFPKSKFDKLNTNSVRLLVDMLKPYIKVAISEAIGKI